METVRERVLLLTVALTVAVLFAAALASTTGNAGPGEVTAAQLIRQGQPGTTYTLVGTVVAGSVRHNSTLEFRVRDRKLNVSVLVSYTGAVPDPFAGGREVLVAVRKDGSHYLGQPDSLTTKLPSEFRGAPGSHGTITEGA